MLLKWAIENKYKLLLLYALKVALFVPLVASASEQGTLTISSSTITSISPELYERYGSYAFWGYLSKSLSKTALNNSDLCLGGTGLGGGVQGGSGPFYIQASTTYIGIDIFTQLGLGSSSGGGGDCTEPGYYYIMYSEFPAVDNLYNSFLHWTIYYDGITAVPVSGNCNVDPTTRIVDFNPQDGATTTSPVNFSLEACIDPADVGDIKGVNLTLHNIDQNVLLLSDFSPSDVWLIQERDIQNPGNYTFSTTTVLGEGNYRLEACIERSYFWGFIRNPFSTISDCTSHQFIVGQPTFIGSVSQSIFGQTNDFYEGLTATSSEALASTCNPLGGNFDVRQCLAFLFIPDGASLNDTMNNAREGILSRVPWGYFTRAYTILTSTATSSLPSFTTTIQIGPGQDMTPETTTITIDTNDMIAGGGALLDSINDPITNKNARDVFMPMVQLLVALGVITTILADLVSSHKHANEEKSRGGTLS